MGGHRNNSRRVRVGPGRVLLALFAVVLVSDQVTKWLAWRHVSGALINEGGFIALRPGVRAWFAAPTAGALADLVGILLVLGGLACLIRRPRRTPTLLGGGLVAAGWSSNLLDRLGLHQWSAPGSVRGVVDFVPSVGLSRANLADVWIAVGVLVLCAEAARRLARTATRSSLRTCDSASSCSRVTAASRRPERRTRPRPAGSTPSTSRSTPISR
jgi:lipoprotein signal peptidase